MNETVERPTKIAKNFMDCAVEWVLSDYYCPSCGKRDMWQECGSGEDYYHNASVRCASCDHDMCCVEIISRVAETTWWDRPADWMYHAWTCACRRIGPDRGPCDCGIAPPVTEALPTALLGKIAGIDGLVRNALIVAEGECALRLVGIQALAEQALSITEQIRSSLESRRSPDESELLAIRERLQCLPDAKILEVLQSLLDDRDVAWQRVNAVTKELHQAQAENRERWATEHPELFTVFPARKDD